MLTEKQRTAKSSKPSQKLCCLQSERTLIIARIATLSRIIVKTYTLMKAVIPAHIPAIPARRQLPSQKARRRKYTVNGSVPIMIWSALVDP